MKTSFALAVFVALISVSAAFDFGSFLPAGQRKKAEKASGNANDMILAANAAAGKEVIKPLSEQEGPMRLFFTASPTPSPSPTPSTSPTPSVTPTPSSSPIPSVSTTPSPTPSKKASTGGGGGGSTPAPIPTTYIRKRVPPTTIDETGETTIDVDFTQDEEETAGLEVGDTATVKDFLVEGDFSAATTGRMLIPGVMRQISIGLKVFFGDGPSEFFFITPTGRCGGLNPPETPITIDLGIKNLGARLGVRFRVSTEGLNPNPVCRPRISFRVTMTLAPGTTPTPLPSNN